MTALPGKFYQTLPDGSNAYQFVQASESPVLDVKDVILTLDTSQYGSGDVLAATQEVTNVMETAGGTRTLSGIQVVDEDDQGGAFDLLFFRSNVSIGTENAAFSIDDAGSREFLGWVSIAAADFTDWGGFRSAFIHSSAAAFKIGMLEAAAGSKSIFIAAISRDTKTYSASGIRVKLCLFGD